MKEQHLGRHDGQLRPLLAVHHRQLRVVRRPRCAHNLDVKERQHLADDFTDDLGAAVYGQCPYSHALLFFSRHLPQMPKNFA